MAGSLDVQRLSLVFQARPDILDGIQKAADSPSRITLFNDIANFVHDQLSGPDEPATKRRRVDVSSTNGHAPSTAADGSSTANPLEAAATEIVLLEIADISVSIPQRKKYTLVFTKNYIYAKVVGSSAPIQGIVYAWKDIEYVFYLPVPDKAQVQHNYILFPQDTSIASIKPTSATDAEPLVFTVPSTAPKPGSVTGPASSAAAAVSDTYSSLFHWAITTQLRVAGNMDTSVVSADPKVFHSVQRQAHRPNERAVHVKGFRGSKDGYLFFLPNGILWGYKKPLLFIPLERIVAVSYTSVLQRTFNMVVEVDVADKGGEEQTEEIEFAMLDQEDYGGIDETYVRRHGLQDRSMAEQRKAKRELAENAKGGKKAADGAEGAPDGGDADGMTELEKAQVQAEQQLQDDEDEDEEDYDPGSDGESEGEGSSSEEEEDDDAEGEEGPEGYDEEEEEEEGYAEDIEDEDGPPA